MPRKKIKKLGFSNCVPRNKPYLHYYSIEILEGDNPEKIKAFIKATKELKKDFYSIINFI